MRWPWGLTTSLRSASTNISTTSSPGRSRRSRCGACGRSPRARVGSSRTSTCAGFPSAPEFSAPTPERGCIAPTVPLCNIRDGWSAYAWKGSQVPAWTIEHPERITRSTFANTFEPVLRNCMIEIMTPERFIESGGPCPRLGRRDRRSMAQALGLSRRDHRIVDGRRGRERHARGRRLAQALRPARALAHAHRTGSGCLDLWPHGRSNTRAWI